MNDLISIIVPVYNTQDYLSECIDSILNQTYENIEIILIDDGSNDNSPEICDDYLKKSNKVKVIHQENLGSLEARKTGLNVAKGKYIGFVDSDDWIDFDMFQTLYSKAISTHACVVTSLICKEYSDKSLIIKDAITPGIYVYGGEAKELYKKLMNCGSFTEGGIHASLCTKLFDKDILQSIMNEVDSRIINGDDAAVLYPVLSSAKTVCITDYAFYHYRMRDASITHSIDERYYERTNILYLHLKEYFEKHECSQILLSQLNQYLLNQVLTGLQRRYTIQQKTVFRFPYEIVEKNSNIILYGAGDVGQSYFEQIKDSEYCNLTLWVDRENEKYTSMDLPVSSIDNLFHIDADSILIAINNYHIAAEIVRELKEKGIDPSKILWKQPKVLLNSLLIE